MREWWAYRSCHIGGWAEHGRETEHDMADEIRDDGIERILVELNGLRESFDAKIRYDEARELAVATMAEELNRHRQGVFQAQLRTVLLDLVQIFDDISQMITAPECAPGTAAQLIEVRGAVEHALARQGAEVLVSEGDIVDRGRHKVVAVLTSPEPADDRRIAERLRPGFSWNERVLRPEWVTAYRFVDDDGALVKAADAESGEG